MHGRPQRERHRRRVDLRAQHAARRGPVHDLRDGPQDGCGDGPPLLVRGQRAAEHHLVEVGVGERGVAVGAAEGDEVLHRVRADRHGVQPGAEAGERLGVQGGEQARLAAEQRVDGGGRRAHVGGEGAQAQRGEAAGRQRRPRALQQAQAQRRVVDLRPGHGRQARPGDHRTPGSGAADQRRRPPRATRAGARPRRPGPPARSPETGSTTCRYALSFGSVPDGRTTTRSPPWRSRRLAAAPQHEDVRRRTVGAPSPPEAAPGAARRRRRGRRAPSGRESPAVGVHAVRGRQLVEPVEQPGAGGLEAGGEVGRPGPRRRCRPCRGRVRVDAVPERLLVAVDQPRSGAGDPLEAGQGLGEARAVRGGDRAQHRRRDDRGRDQPVRITGTVPQDVVAEQRARLVAGEHPPAAAGSGDAERAPVGVGVEGDGQVGADPLGRRQQGVGRRRAPPGSGRRRSGRRRPARPAP